jgi:hypothetical protein
MSSRAPAGSNREETSSTEALTTLRGSSVGKVDSRRVVRVLVVLCLVALAVLVVVFSVAGAHRNTQVSSLHHQGVKVDMTVTTCAVLIGGSGSTPAGDACRGAFTLDGHRYVEAIPGSATYSPGKPLSIVVVPHDPALLAPAKILAGEQSTWTVFVVPGILFIVLLGALVGFVIVRSRREDAAPPVR